MQAAVKKNIAYDLSRFDRRTVVREQVDRERAESRAKAKTVKKAKVKARPAISAFAVFSFLVCIAMVVLTLFSYVKLTELSDQSSKLKNELATMREETQMLEIEKNRKFSAEQIKAQAVDRLGMQKLDKSQITYLDLGQSDKVEILADTQLMGESNILAGIVSGFQRLVEYIN